MNETVRLRLPTIRSSGLGIIYVASANPDINGDGMIDALEFLEFIGALGRAT